MVSENAKSGVFFEMFTFEGYIVSRSLRQYSLEGSRCISAEFPHLFSNGTKQRGIHS